MFHTFKPLDGHYGQATDWGIGCGRTFLFDIQSWKVGLLVLDERKLLTEREVIFPVAALEHPNRQNSKCRIRLVKEEVNEYLQSRYQKVCFSATGDRCGRVMRSLPELSHRWCLYTGGVSR